MDKELEEKFRVYESEIMQIQEQMRAIEQASVELKNLNLDFEELPSKVGKEILASIGRGIFVKAKLLSDELTVDIGSGNFVKKTVSETKTLIEEQIKKLDEMNLELDKELGRINEELTQTMLSSKNSSSGHCSCGHEHCECEDESCECDDED